ncbi:MAG: hypothetical protein Q9160_000914 [Pyrenula sp. 1 TL-2023]
MLAAISLALPKTTTISSLIRQLSYTHSIPEDSLRLLFSGRHLTHLDPATPLSSIPYLQQDSTLHLLSPIRGGAISEKMSEQQQAPTTSQQTSTPETKEPSPQPSSTVADTSTSEKPTPTSTPPPTRTVPRKPRCTFKTCKALAQPIVGDCGFCGQKFCGKHRMLESHDCKGLDDAKDLERQRNRDKLESERTQVIRGV